MPFQRYANLEGNKVRSEQGAASDLVVVIAFASEEPYERWWGIEVLDCSPESVRLGRLNDGAPLLYNHNWDDLRGTHVAGGAVCDADHVARAKVRITSATQVGRDTIALVETDVLTKVSVGYEIYTVIEQTTSKSGEKISRQLDGALFGRILNRSEEEARGDVAAFRRSLDAAAGSFERSVDAPTVYRVIDWEPLENSLVTVPADNTVGVGRSLDRVAGVAPHSAGNATGVTGDVPVQRESAIQLTNSTQGKNMEDDNKPQAEATLRAAQGNQTGGNQPGGDQTRIAQIQQLGRQFERFGARDMADAAIAGGETVPDFTARLMKKISAETEKWDPKLGLSENETRQYSLFRAITAQLTKNWDGAGFERECHDEILRRCENAGVPTHGGFFLPSEVRKLRAGASMVKRARAQRDMVVGTAAQGGYLVGTDYHADEFVDLLRAETLAGKLGVRFISGLVGNWTAAKKTAGTTAYWLAAESTEITESGLTLGQIVMTPRSVGGYTEISRPAMLQAAPDAEALVIDDLREALSLAIDAAVFNGTGASGQPTGILYTSGIGSVSGASLGYAGIIETQTDLANANALTAGCRYVGTPTVAGLLMQRVRVAGTDTPLWSGNMLDGTVGGFAAHGSTQIPDGTLLFGNFGDVIIGEWGTLEIAVDPNAGFKAGIVGVRAFASIDVGVRRAASFTAASSIT